MTTTNENGITISRVYSERVDVRRHKRYGLELSVAVSLSTPLPDDSKVSLGNIISEKGENGRYRPSLPYARPNHRGFHVHQNWVDGKRVVTGCTLSFWIPADRPSDIPGEHRAIQLIEIAARENEDRKYGERFSLEEILVARISAEIERAANEENSVHVAEQASHLGSWLAKQADKQAREALGWEQKLAALRAELEAEQAVQLEKLLETFDAKIEQDDNQWEPRAVELAKQKAPEALKNHDAFPGFRMIGNHEPLVKPEEV